MTKNIKRFIFSVFPILLFCSCGEGELDDLRTTLDNVVSENQLGYFPLIAHQGCWSGDNCPRNSLAAFREALQKNIFGAEFDVRRTLDGLHVISHGADFCGLPIAQTNYQELCRFHLSNGETIPLLEDFIKLYASSNTKVKMVLDLKACNINDIIELLNRYDVLSDAIFVSFYKKHCNELVKRGLGDNTYYLYGDTSPKDVYDAGYGGIDYSYLIYQSNPEWITEAKELGLKISVWNVNDIKSIKDYIKNDIIVTTDAVSHVFNEKDFVQ